MWQSPLARCEHRSVDRLTAPGQVGGQGALVIRVPQDGERSVDDGHEDRFRAEHLGEPDALLHSDARADRTVSRDHDPFPIEWLVHRKPP